MNPLAPVSATSMAHCRGGSPTRPSIAGARFQAFKPPGSTFAGGAVFQPARFAAGAGFQPALLFPRSRNWRGGTTRTGRVTDPPLRALADRRQGGFKTRPYAGRPPVRPDRVNRVDGQ